MPKAKLTVLGLGVAPAPDDPAAEVAALRAKLLGDGDRLVITVARLEHQKGIDVLIEAIARMIPDHPGWRFAVAGDGVDEAKLKALAKERGVDKHLQLPRPRQPPASLPPRLGPVPADLAVGGVALHHRRGVSGRAARRGDRLFRRGGTDRRRGRGRGADRRCGGHRGGGHAHPRRRYAPRSAWRRRPWRNPSSTASTRTGCIGSSRTPITG